MKIKNNSDKHLIIYNGKTYVKLSAGECCELDDKVASEQLEKFGGFLEEEKPAPKKKIFSKKATKKGKDKKLEKFKD